MSYTWYYWPTGPLVACKECKHVIDNKDARLNLKVILKKRNAIGQEENEVRYDAYCLRCAELNGCDINEAKARYERPYKPTVVPLTVTDTTSTITRTDGFTTADKEMDKVIDDFFTAIRYIEERLNRGRER